jgi:hypothetical protein
MSQNSRLPSITLALLTLAAPLPAFAFDEVIWEVARTTFSSGGGKYAESSHQIGYSNTPLLCGTVAIPCSIAVDSNSLVDPNKGTGSFTATTYVLQGSVFPSPPFLPDVVVASYQSSGTFSLATGTGTGKTQSTSGQKKICFSINAAGSGIASPNAIPPYTGYAVLEIDTNFCP